MKSKRSGRQGCPSEFKLADDLSKYKEEVLRVARDLKYSEDILWAIKKAETEGQVIRALGRGRNMIRS